jgi:hypothetical protein
MRTGRKFATTDVGALQPDAAREMGITKNRLRLTRSAALVSAALVAFVVPAIGATGPAFAGTTVCVYEGYDRACATDNWPASRTSRIEVCDNERDGHGVYVIADGSLGPDVKLGDGNGSDPGCGTRSLNDNLEKIKICEELGRVDSCAESPV